MISVIIPTRNRRTMVMDAIQSALAQRGTELEVIVVDDGSTDGTADIVRTRFPEVRVIRTANAGPGAARNKGAEMAGGRVLMFLDSDDLWTQDHARLLLAELDNGADVAYGITRNRNQVSGGTFLIPDQGTGPSGMCFHALTRWCFTVPSAIAVTARAFRETGGFICTDAGEDWDFFLRLAAKFPFSFVPEVITIRHLHAGSLCSGTDIRGKILTTLEHITRVLDHSPCTRPEDYAFITQAKTIAIHEGHLWKTFQDFYIATRRIPLPALRSSHPRITNAY